MVTRFCVLGLLPRVLVVGGSCGRCSNLSLVGSSWFGGFIGCWGGGEGAGFVIGGK